MNVDVLCLIHQARWTELSEALSSAPNILTKKDVYTYWYLLSLIASNRVSTASSLIQQQLIHHFNSPRFYFLSTSLLSFLSAPSMITNILHNSPPHILSLSFLKTAIISLLRMHKRIPFEEVCSLFYRFCPGFIAIRSFLS